MSQLTDTDATKLYAAIAAHRPLLPRVLTAVAALLLLTVLAVLLTHGYATVHNGGVMLGGYGVELWSDQTGPSLFACTDQC